MPTIGIAQIGHIILIMLMFVEVHVLVRVMDIEEAVVQIVEAEHNIIMKIEHITVT